MTSHQRYLSILLLLANLHLTIVFIFSRLALSPSYLNLELIAILTHSTEAVVWLWCVNTCGVDIRTLSHPIKIQLHIQWFSVQSTASQDSLQSRFHATCNGSKTAWDTSRVLSVLWGLYNKTRQHQRWQDRRWALFHASGSLPWTSEMANLAQRVLDSELKSNLDWFAILQ